MGLGELVATIFLTLSYRAVEKVASRIVYEYPIRGYLALFDPKHKSELARMLATAHPLARMIDATYDVFKHGSNSEAPEGIRSDFGFETVPAEEFVDPDVRKLLNDGRCHALVFRKRLSRGAVQIVVAVRGTHLLDYSDLMEDLKLSFEHLHTSERLKKIRTLVQELTSRYGCESVRLTGHSLGAAIAFIAARQLYLENINVEAHFFALPFMPLDKIIEKIAYIMEFEMALAQWILQISSLDKVVEDICGDLIEKLAPIVSGCSELVDEARREFNMLVDWKPYIYVQNFDIISNGYIEFFRNNSSSAGLSKITAFLHRLGMDPKALHLCPSAILITGKAGLGTLTSHGIAHWMDVEPLRFKAVEITNMCVVKEFRSE